MYKNALVIFALAAAIGCIEAKMTMEEAAAAFMEIGKACAEETGATPEDITELKSLQAPTTHGAKCMAACVYKHIGVIQDGKYVADALVTASKMIYDEGSPEFEKVKGIAAACAAVVADGDECEVAAKARECEMDKFEEAGIKLPM